MNRHSTGHYYVQRLGGGKSIEKLLEDKNKLERQLKATRQNNAIYRKTVNDLTSKNREIDGRLQEIKAEVATGAEELIVMRTKINELLSNNTDISSELRSSRKEKAEVMATLEKIDNELKMEKEKRLQQQEKKLELIAQNLINEKLILELNTNSSKITNELELCKNENVKLLNVQNKLEVCEDELKLEIKKGNSLELENSEISQSLKKSKEEVSNHELLYEKCIKDLERATSSRFATTTSTTPLLQPSGNISMTASPLIDIIRLDATLTTSTSTTTTTTTTTITTTTTSTTSTTTTATTTMTTTTTTSLLVPAGCKVQDSVLQAAMGNCWKHFAQQQQARKKFRNCFKVFKH